MSVIAIQRRFGVSETNGNGKANGGATAVKIAGWFVPALLASGLAGIVTVGSILWALNSSVISLSVGQGAMLSRMASIESSLAAGSSDRYTGSQAALDRGRSEAAIAAKRERITHTSDRINAVERELSAMKARLERTP